MYRIVHAKRSMSIASDELVLIGRSNKCDLQLNDPSASRVHCRLLSRDGKVFLTDAGSRWGTFLNGLRVQEAELTVGDKITVGDTDLRLVVETDAIATTFVPPKGNTDVVQWEHSETDLRTKWSPARPSVIPVQASANPFVPARYLHKRFLRYLPSDLVANTKTGMTFRAKDTVLDREVALKLFRSELFRDEAMRQRFLRGVRTMVSFRHPNIVRMHDARIHDNLCFTVCEYVEGTSAAGLIQKIGIAGMLNWQTTVRIGIDICDALEEIHGQGIVHRNIKPEHILIRKKDKRALLGDVTLAKAWDQSQLERITTKGDIIGELAWQPPEQLGTGEPVDHRFDLYQLGLTLYALLTGKNPFAGGQAVAVLDHILNQPLPQPKAVHLAVPPILEDIILKVLAKAPSDRHANATELRKDLQRVLKYSYER